MEKVSKDKISTLVLYASLLAFIVFTGYILHVNQEVLYTAHDRSEFLVGAPFFDALLSKPFGLLQYVGAWLTQLFYSPLVGAGVLLAIWILIFLAGAKAFRLTGCSKAFMLLPIACLLTSVIDLGYWIYIFSIRGYWFSQSVGYLAMMLLLWAARCTPRRWHLVWYVLGFCLYPVLGWFALLFVLCLAISDKLTWREILAVVIVLFTASIWRALLYSNMRLDDVMLAGLPRFVTPVESNMRPSIPFYVLGGVSLLIPLCGRYLDKWFAPALCAVVGIAFTWSLMYSDKNYLDEMRMIRLAEDDNWKEVVSVAANNTTPTPTMVMLKNIALMNDGGLLDRSFKLGNNAVNASNPDSLHVSLLNTAAPLVCYNYGMMNEAIRLSYENAVSTGFSPFYIKMIARCANATGEKKLVERFTRMLQSYMLEANWQPSVPTAKVKSLHNAITDGAYGVENNCERYVIDNLSLMADTTNKDVSEQALFYSMMRRDSGRFWTSIRKYVKSHMDETFPRHAMEAYIMYMDKAPEEKKIMLPVEQEVYDRYKQFWSTLDGHLKNGVDTKDISAKMRAAFGDTYWYYNIFGRNLYQ